MIIPTQLYFNERGYVKIDVSIAKGKKLFDKRQDMKTKDARKELERYFKERGIETGKGRVEVKIGESARPYTFISLYPFSLLACHFALNFDICAFETIINLTPFIQVQSIYI